NYTITVKERDQNIIFLRKVIPGKADRSYGIHVAALAGLPAGIIQRAREVLEGLECLKTGAPYETAACSETAGHCRGDNLAGKNYDIDSEIIIRELGKIDISSTTPLEALNLLARLQTIISL
ncbi:MAG: MutS-related protein, partial [Desulfocucumaceae bacterium]